MGPSTFISALLHIAIMLFVIVSFPTSSMTPAPLVAIPIDLATPSENTKVKAGTRDAKDEAPLAGTPEEQKKHAVKEKVAAAPDKTAPTKKVEATPKPEAKSAPKEEKKAEAVPAPQPKPTAPTRKPEPPKQQAKAETPKAAPAPKKPAFDTDRISALLDKIPDAVDEPAPQEFAEETKPVAGQTTGTEIAMSSNELDALRARISDCWTPPPGGLGADAIFVKIRLKLNQDGTLEGYPTVANNGSSPFFQAAADSAVRAVFQCQPYTLPVEKYALWRDMILNFDPSQMYRSG